MRLFMTGEQRDQLTVLQGFHLMVISLMPSLPPLLNFKEIEVIFRHATVIVSSRCFDIPYSNLL